MNLSRRGFLKTTGIAAAGLAATRWNVDAAVHEPWLGSATKNELADIVVALAKKLGATYGDIRINRYRIERLKTFLNPHDDVSLLRIANVRQGNQELRIGHEVGCPGAGANR